MEKVLCIEANDYNSAYIRGMEFIKNISKGFDRKINNNIVLAFEEVFVNILKYNSDKKDLNILIDIKSDKNIFKVKICDNGKKFNPLLKEPPDFTLTADEREIGGMGIYILKKFTDLVEYEYIDNYNVLTFGVNISDEN